MIETTCGDVEGYERGENSEPASCLVDRSAVSETGDGEQDELHREQGEEGHQSGGRLEGSNHKDLFIASARILAR